MAGEVISPQGKAIASVLLNRYDVPVNRLLNNYVYAHRLAPLSGALQTSFVVLGGRDT